MYKNIVFLESGIAISFTEQEKAEEYCKRHNITWFDTGGWE